jgi:hypothetical protein
MSTSLFHLARKRQRIIEKSTQQREQLELYISDVKQPLHVVEKAVSLVGFVRKHPVIMLSTTLVLHHIRVKVFQPWLYQLGVIQSISHLLKRIVNF